MVCQATTPPIFPIPLLRFYKSRFPQVVDCPAGGGFGEVQVFGDGWDGGPAGVFLVGSVQKVDVDGDGSVGQIQAVGFR